MRTTTLKIGNESKTALLIAGGSGFKIYSAEGVSGWILVVDKSVQVFHEQSAEFKAIARYVNLKYQPTSAHEAIRNDFKAVVDAQAARKQAPLLEPEA